MDELFDLNVNGVPAPEMLTTLQVSMDSGSLNRITKTAEATIRITNPNVAYYQAPVKIFITQDNGAQEEITGHEFDENGQIVFTKHIEFENIKEQEDTISTHFLVEAYLDLETEYWTKDAIKTQTYGFAEADWTYKKTPLKRLEFANAAMVPADGKITSDQKGELHYVITNTNNDVFNTIYAPDTQGSNGIYIVLVGSDSVEEIVGPTFGYNNENLYVDYTDIDVITYRCSSTNPGTITNINRST